MFSIDREDIDIQLVTGQEILLSIQLMGIPIEKTVKVEIIHMKRNGKQMVIGNRFSDLDDEIKKGFENYLKIIKEFKRTDA